MDLVAFATGLATLALIYGLLAVGLNIQFGFAGVLNFGYVAFFAVGAFASAIVTLPPPGSEAYLAANARYEVGLGQSVAAGLLAAAVAGGLLALLIGATSARLASHYLAVATFAMAEVLRTILVNETWLTRGEFGIANVPEPGKGTLVPADAYATWYLGATAVIVAVLVVAAFRLGEMPFGRLLRAIRDDETAAKALGKPVGAARLKALVIGGALGGVAGALWTHSLGVVHVGQFVPIITFQIWLAMLLGGVGNHWGVLVGAVLLVAIREGTRFVGEVPVLGEWAAGLGPQVLPALRFVLIGLLLILVVRFFPRGVLPERLRRAPSPPAVRAAAPVPATPAVGDHGVREGEPLLEVRDVARSFGGVRAVDGATFTVRAGSITGLIGPNGAGKSTMIDIVSGMTRPERGEIVFAGRKLRRLSPARIANAGIGRTFQTPRLFMTMTVFENMMVAGAGPEAENLVPSLLRPSRRRALEAETAARADALLSFVRLDDKRDVRAGELSGGQRKLLSLARLMMREPALMLLDEPAAGLNRVLAREVFARIRELNGLGVTFVIVEHEMDLVMRTCDHVVVMHQGRVIAEGPPAAVRRDRQVIEAYLGGVVA